VFGNTSRARCRIIELPRTRYPPELLEHVPARTLLSNFPDSSERPHSKTGYSIRNPTLLETTLNSARYFTLEKSYPEICEMLDATTSDFASGSSKMQHRIALYSRQCLKVTSNDMNYSYRYSCDVSTHRLTVPSRTHDLIDRFEMARPVRRIAGSVLSV